MTLLDLSIYVQTELYLLDLDKLKLLFFYYKYDFLANVANQKQIKHTKIRQYLLIVNKDKNRPLLTL